MKHTEKEELSAIISSSLNNAVSYSTYRALVEAHVAQGTTTGPNQTEALANYTLLNHSRMKRLDKTTKVSEEVIEKFQNFSGNQTWLVITESWCGDAAQTMPAMNKLTQLNDGIEFKVVLRDEHLALMNKFLTQGSMSIPKLIVLDKHTNEVLHTWGPRPSSAKEMVENFKLKHGSLTPEFKEELQVWYNKDKSQNTIKDLSELID